MKQQLTGKLNITKEIVIKMIEFNHFNNVLGNTITLRMAVKVFINISILVNTRQQSYLLKGAALKELPLIYNAYLVVEDDLIAAYGEMKNFDSTGFDKN
ncbi:MAG: hypothetical protein ABIR81_12330, partial [Ginsengibacter sp.]